MAYEKNSTWVDDLSPLSATRLNKLETQYDQVKSELAEAGTSDIRVHAQNIDNDGDGSGLDAESLGGLRFVKPGDTVYFEDLSERASLGTGTTYVDEVAYFLPRLGKYRFTGELKCSNASWTGYCRLVTPGGAPITNEFSILGNVYASFSLDFAVSIPINGVVILQVKGTDSGARESIRNARFKFADGIPATNSPEAFAL